MKEWTEYELRFLKKTYPAVEKTCPDHAYAVVKKAYETREKPVVTNEPDDANE